MEALPVEIMIEIFKALPDPRSAISFAKTCTIWYRVLQIHFLQIMPQVLQNCIPEPVLVDATYAYEANTPAIREEFKRNGVLIRRSIDFIRNNILNDPRHLISLCNLYTTAQYFIDDYTQHTFINIERFKNSEFSPEEFDTGKSGLTSDVSKTYWDEEGQIPVTRPLKTCRTAQVESEPSLTERIRLQRAFYRFEACRRLFPYPIPGTGGQKPGNMMNFLNSLPNEWETEEFKSIYEYVYYRMMDHTDHCHRLLQARLVDAGRKSYSSPHEKRSASNTLEISSRMGLEGAMIDSKIPAVHMTHLGLPFCRSFLEIHDTKTLLEICISFPHSPESLTRLGLYHDLPYSLINQVIRQLYGGNIRNNPESAEDWRLGSYGWRKWGPRMCSKHDLDYIFWDSERLHRIKQPSSYPRWVPECHQVFSPNGIPLRPSCGSYGFLGRTSIPKQFSKIETTEEAAQKVIIRPKSSKFFEKWLEQVDY